MTRYAFASVGPRANTAAEDRAAVIEHPAGLVVVVADGAGNSGNGARAAERVVGAVRRALDGHALLPDAGYWARTLMDIDLALSRDGGETTAVVLGVAGGRIAGASVGDSAAWLVRADGVEELTQAQHRKPLVGSGEAVPVPFTRDGAVGTLLAATDGLHKYAPLDAIARTALGDDLAATAEQLVNLVRLPNGTLQDDVTVVLYR